MTTVDFEPLTVAVPLWEEPPGVFRVGKSRVLLELVLRAFRRGETPEGIVRSYRSLQLADVYAVISLYLSNPGPFDEYLRQSDEEAEAVRGKLEAAGMTNRTRREDLQARAGQRVDPLITFLVDQNFNEHIVDGMTRRDPTLELTHVREVGFAEAPDPVVLERAAANGLVLLTHDRKTIPAFAYARVADGLPMPGVFLVSGDMPTGQAIDELLTAAQCLSPDECKDSVIYFPL